VTPARKRHYVGQAGRTATDFAVAPAGSTILRRSVRTGRFTRFQGAQCQGLSGQRRPFLQQDRVGNGDQFHGLRLLRQRDTESSGTDTGRFTWRQGNAEAGYRSRRFTG